MRKILIAAALAPTALMLMAAAPQDIIDQQIDKFTEALAGKGFTPTGWVNNGTLAQGKDATVSVSLKGDSVFGVVGVCDNECGDLNLRLIDSSGKEVDNDLEADSNPLLATNAQGNYTIKVSMVKCTSPKCAYRLVAYKK